MQIGSVSMYFVVALLAYLLFVFISERLNPFSKPNSFTAGLGRWRFARTIAVVFLICSCLGLVAAEFSSISQVVALSISTAMFGVFWAIMGTRRVLKRNQAFAIANTSKPVKSREAEESYVDAQLSPQTEPDAANQSSKQFPHNRSELSTAQVGYIEKSTTDEHELELELAVANMPPDLTDFDQSIVEAEFESVYGGTEIGEAFPNAEPTGSAIADNTVHNTEHAEFDFSSDVTSILDEISANTKNSVSVDLLREKYRDLSVSKNALQEELATLKVLVKKSQAAERKSEAVRDHAVLQKNKALEIAAMERKKRRLTEVKASKVIMKLRRNVEILEARETQTQLRKTAALNKPKAVS